MLNSDLVALDVKANDKDGIIAELVDILVASGKIKEGNRNEALESVLKRESQMSTGIQSGVAIPHGKSAVVNELAACIAISKTDKSFDALDGNPSRIFVLTVSPADKTGPHVQFLAEISRLLTKQDVRDQLLSADSAEKVVDIFTA